MPYFAKGRVEDEFLASAALALKSRVYCRTESTPRMGSTTPRPPPPHTHTARLLTKSRSKPPFATVIPVHSLVVIERGIAAKDGRITAKGACLGEDMVLNSVWPDTSNHRATTRTHHRRAGLVCQVTFRDLMPAIALTFVVQGSVLEKRALETLLHEYPLARREIRSSSFKLAFTRAVIQVRLTLPCSGRDARLGGLNRPPPASSPRAQPAPAPRVPSLPPPSRSQILTRGLLHTRSIRWHV